MQTVQQKKDLSWAAMAWDELVKLTFITRFFDWLMKLLAIVTEFFSLPASIYIIVLAGVPSIRVENLYTLAMALIIGSPELLIVGAFKMAQRELAKGNKQAWWLMGSCFFLLFLTALTVIDLFVWHWSAWAIQTLMGVRVIGSLAYTFTRGIVTNESEPVNVAPGSPVHSLLAEFTVSIQNTVNQVNQSMVVEVNQVRLQLLSEVNHQHQQFVAEVHTALQAFGQHQQQLTTVVNGMSQGVQIELQGAIEVLGQQSQDALDAAVERLERANSRRMEAVYTRLEQVKVTLESNPSIPAVNVAGSPLRLPSRVHAQPIQRGASEPATPVQVHQEAVNLEGVNGASKPGEGLLDGSKVNAGRAFAVNHYQVHQALPTLLMIQTAVVCSKTLASRARGLATVDLGLKVSSGE